MNKFLFVMLIVLSLSGCFQSQTPEARKAYEEQERADRIARQQRKIDILQAKYHACDKNDGIKDIREGICNKGFCSAEVVICKDGMQRVFEH
jgi:cytochrome c biogenesis protein ResB